MIKNLTCIECPKGCHLTIEVEKDYVINVNGNQCEKGESYARSEVEDPVRLLTSSVLTKGLALKMVPVRTDKPVPRARIFEAMDAIRKIRLCKRVKAGDAIAANFLDLNVNLIVTRDAS